MRQRTQYRRKPHAFPDDFPQRVVWFKHASGLSWVEIARRLGVDSVTVRRWWQRGVAQTGAAGKVEGQPGPTGRDKEDAPMSMKLQDDYTPVALYARVSSDRQDVDLSVSAQLRALRDYAQKHGYLVAREYVDEAESGRIADRPQFQKMLNEASKPEAPFQEILIRRTQ